ncbi:2-dehydro-3-deoxy-6-phosphogalactonate aldolase [Candidatus Uabimicrobium sp. HlEnr_7]|uniref:2-dehydro-3-deoxy-6-phosphogalactonate aldolase n=1 Tax=Candidatus Uabimicrobium helgolandensis TaxID=3095367 RepID=UPI00355831F4
MNSKQKKIFDSMPIIAILRNIEPSQVIDIATELVLAGIRIIEIPLNCPDALKSIKILQENFSHHIVCGAGTVVTTKDVENIKQINAEIAVAPNTCPKIISHILEKNIIPIPGFTTPTEAFHAINSGAKHLKLFPAEFYGPKYLRSIRVVLPSDVSVFAVGGIHPGNIKSWMKAGATGFAIGSALFEPGFTTQDTREMSQEVVTAFRKARHETRRLFR